MVVWYLRELPGGHAKSQKNQQATVSSHLGPSESRRGAGGGHQRTTTAARRSWRGSRRPPRRARDERRKRRDGAAAAYGLPVLAYLREGKKWVKGRRGPPADSSGGRGNREGEEEAVGC
ncbi:unnamed protein product [Urochloa humidicola]